MGKEVKRGLIRIASNYGRLLASLVISILLIPLLLHSVGDGGVSLILLFGSTVGIAAMFQEIVQRSMVRELGSAHHSGSDEVFQRMFNSAITVGGAIALLSAIVFAALWLLVPIFNFETSDGVVHERLDDAARGMVAARGVASVVIVLAAPVFNMYLVTERMVAFNFWQTIVQRGHAIIGAALLLVFPPASVTEGVIFFAWSSSAVIIAATLIASAQLLISEKRLIPRLGLSNLRDIRDIVQTTGWNSLVIAAMNLYTRVDQIIMNIAFGLFGNLTFGLAVLLTGYSRRGAGGMTDGLDAVSARMQGGGADADEAIHALVKQSTRLHGIVTFPTAIAIALLAEPLLRLWLSSRLENPAESIPPTILMIQILMVGTAIRSIADGWMRILYGLGKVREYAWPIVLSGLANPLLAIGFIWMLPGGTTIEFLGPAIATSIVLVAVPGIWLPRIVARALGMSYVDVVGPLARPLLAAAAPGLIIIGADVLIETWEIWHLAAVSALYAAIYALLTVSFTMQRGDREMALRIFGRVRSRLAGRRVPGRSDDADDPDASGRQSHNV